MKTRKSKEQVPNSTCELRLNVENLVESMRKEMGELEILSDECCIYRVPQRFRDINEKAYTPKVVSIGPFHHGKAELKEMEDHKRRYLGDFLQRIKLDLEEYMELILKLETRLRNSYAETIKHSREEFLKMMAIDGAFIIEYLLKRYYGGLSKNDRIFQKQRLTIDIRYDLLLLENQLPFFFLHYLFNLSNDQQLSIVTLVNHFLRHAISWKFLPVDNSWQENFQVQHFVDLLRIYMLPSKPHTTRACKSLSLPTISELHRAGVKFKLSSSKCLFDIRFSNGILEIPKLILNDQIELCFRNMQVFEQCHDCGNFVGDYIFVMDMLIDNSEDVALLTKKGIIENWIEDSQAAATFFNNLGKEDLIITSRFYFSDLIEDLNAYCKTRRHRWKATLKLKYFNNPWTIISVIAAAFLLLLSVIQTVCSILQVL